MTPDDQYTNERVILLQGLTSQKDSLLKATEKIEPLFCQYRFVDFVTLRTNHVRRLQHLQQLQNCYVESVCKRAKCSIQPIDNNFG